MTVLCELGQLKVRLSESETVKYNIDLVFSDRSSQAASKALAELLRLAAEKANYKSTSTKFLIELYPVFEGGCEVHFIPEASKEGKKVSPIPIKKEWVVFEFFDSESLLQAVSFLCDRKETPFYESELYGYCNRFRLNIKGINRRMQKKISSNFALRTLYSPVFRAVTVEHGKPILKKEALPTLAKYFCR